MIKMSRTSSSIDSQKEWDRISQNPDNVIVSDVLRDSLSHYYTETPTKTQRAVVTLYSETHNLTVLMTLLRLEQSPRGWSLVCVCPTQVAHKVMRAAREDWSHTDLKIGNDKIRDFNVDPSIFRLEIEIPTTQTAGVSECTVIVSCVSEQSTNT